MALHNPLVMPAHRAADAGVADLMCCVVYPEHQRTLVTHYCSLLLSLSSSQGNQEVPSICCWFTFK